MWFVDFIFCTLLQFASCFFAFILKFEVFFSFFCFRKSASCCLLLICLECVCRTRSETVSCDFLSGVPNRVYVCVRHDLNRTGLVLSQSVDVRTLWDVFETQSFELRSTVVVIVAETNECGRFRALQTCFRYWLPPPYLKEKLAMLSFSNAILHSRSFHTSPTHTHTHTLDSHVLCAYLCRPANETNVAPQSTSLKRRNSNQLLAFFACPAHDNRKKRQSHFGSGHQSKASGARTFSSELRYQRNHAERAQRCFAGQCARTGQRQAKH